MVVINHCNPHQLNAYSTVPLAHSTVKAVQQDFAIGSFARFGNPGTTISIKDRPDFYGASHYSMREKLDLEGSLDEFLIMDDRTADSHAIWYVQTTEISKLYTAGAIEVDNPPITHEGEDFTLWQARMLTQDVSIQWACFFAAVRDLRDDIWQYSHPYDPHNPQQEPYTIGLDFSRKEDAEAFVPDAYFNAEFEEIDWSTDIGLRRLISPTPPVVVQLTEEAARESGLLRQWRSARRIPREGDTISTAATYDWDSPKWSQDGTSVAKRGSRSLSLMSPGNDTAVKTCQSRILSGLALSALRNLSNLSGVNALSFKHNRNGSRTLSGLA